MFYFAAAGQAHIECRMNSWPQTSAGLDWLSVEESVARIRDRNPYYNAFITTRLEEALVEADAAPEGPLHRVPYALKDAWDTAGVRTTGGSYRYKDRVPSSSSIIHRSLQAAGGVLMGKTNCSDMSLAPEAASWVGGPTRNPHALSRTAGGSSGGAAAAVAAGMVDFDWGSDIGGSIRLPAAYCGVWGMRLSSGPWPMDGEFPHAPDSLAYMNGQGPIAKSLGHMRAVLDAVAPAMRQPAPAFSPRGVYLYAPKRGKWPTFEADLQALLDPFGDVRRDHELRSMEKAKDLVLAMWASHFEELLECDPDVTLKKGLAAALSGSLLRGRLLKDKYFHPYTAELLVLIALGRYTIFRDPARYRAMAAEYQAQVQNIWNRGYLIAAPVCAYPAPRHGRSNRNPNILTCTMPGNLCDATGLSVPFGKFRDGLPRAFQLMGPPGSEQAIMDFAERLPGL